MYFFQCSLQHFLVKFVTLGIVVSSGVLGAVTRKIFAYPDRLSTSLTRASVTNNSSGSWTHERESFVRKHGKNDHTKQRSFPATALRNGRVQNYTRNSVAASLTPSINRKSDHLNLTGAVPFEMEYLLSQAYNSDYSYDNNNRNGASSSYDEYQNQQSYPIKDNTDMASHAAQIGIAHHHTAEQSNNNGYNYYNSPGSSSGGLQHTYGPPHYQHHEENESFEVEDKVFSKTVVATKALKVGKVIFVFFMVLVVLALAVLGKTGVALSPVVLPLALLPIGIVALLLFIPLFFLFVPLAATGVIGEGRKRRRRRNVDQSTEQTAENFMANLHDILPEILDKIETLEWNC